MTVTVAGSAQRAVAPGTATWRAQAIEPDDDPRAAFERCSRKLNALVEQLSGLGEVTTEAVEVRGRYAGEEDTPVGVEAVGNVRVRCPAAHAGDVAYAAIAAGADHLHGPHFEYERAHEVRGELLGEAVADARAKAERLAAAAGRRLGGVEQIEESGSEVVPVGRLTMAAAGPAEPPDVRPRDLTIAASVRVVFALED